MFSILKRVLLSLMSVVLGVVLCCVLVTIRRTIGDESFYLKGFFQLLVYELVVTLIFSWPGWLLALPAILFLTDLRAWRFWALLALGGALGPLSVYLILAWTSHGRPGLDLAADVWAASVSGLSTLIYLSLLRRSQGLKQGGGH
jgi:hypothetical protein